jgi:hypothetical protein
MARVRVPKIEKAGQPEKPAQQEQAEVARERSPAEQAASVLDTPTVEPAAVEAVADVETIPAKLETEEPQAETKPAEIVGSWRAGDAPPSAETTAEKTPDQLADQAWRLKLSRAKDEYIEAAINRKQCEGELKSAKETEKECLATVQRLIERGPEKLPLFDSQNPSSVTLPAGTTEPLPADENGWRKVPITALDLGSIDGLGDKKRDALIDAIPTLGHFEDKRVEAGASGVDTVLPKGIGKKITDPLEEMHLNYITNWGASQKAGQGEQAAEATDPSASIPNAKQWEAMTDDQQHDYINQRAAQISESVSILTVTLSADFQAGSIAYGRDEAVTDCPRIPGDEMDSWLAGYFDAASDDKGSEEVEPPADDDDELDEDDDSDGDEAPTLSLVGSIDDL